jgi:hypothetical protein
MKTFTTTIHALDPADGEYKEFAGPNIEAPSRKLAFDYCQRNGLGYCHIGNELVMIVPCKKHTSNEPDFDKKIDYNLTDKN